MTPIPPKGQKAAPFDPAKEYRFVCTCCCQRIDPPLIYFCRTCWDEVPTPERIGLYNMHHRGQRTDSKVEKIVRILRHKKADARSGGNKTVPKPTPNGQPAVIPADQKCPTLPGSA
jgi:hypothetical protein